MKVLKCNKCGKMVEVIQGSPCPTMCCGEPMEELVANTTDAAIEKHVPVVEIEGNDVTVKVGVAMHPMIPEHYIEWIVLETKQGIQRKALAPGEEPVRVFSLVKGDEVVAVYAYCNLHGLWKKE